MQDEVVIHTYYGSLFDEDTGKHQMYCVKEQMTDGTKRISKWGLNITTMITLL
jgi:hypothetical protein